ncbi:Peptidyl-prolyl cis-trans isomerase [Methanosarcina siciliae C2J]|uniref:Peptidyl-prolyl cis-trans isomerase n=3 Tax=Methanosarcina siciliae TaxID=38027 RepID=A0A0E3PG33_9EURY|nr:peptidylprolyl isomerase [Methanosarcina siciliae]AKB29335.1 Peptidyl-prolyl cis-trans isomerase [Methanosarcina siciliae T4/M]AKB33267.1 Peptidyl-prolyl cis-trans isomerase [Methanosarcina siciliae HI350]AKB37511.1 Peptidyl-prolyl cis-trans isomerase [Methanosarcina siciliae C2J]
MENSRTVEKGDYLLIDYTGKLDDGTVFDTTLKEKALEAGIHSEEKEYRPFFFRADARQVIKGIDAGVLGMREGEEKTLKIAPEEAYGEYKDYLVQKIPLARLELKEPPEAGKKIITPGGREVKVLDSTETYALLDFNHELASKTLTLEIKLVSIVTQPSNLT